MENRRVGARTLAGVPVDVLGLLESGAESSNHVEQMAMSMANLLRSTVPGIGFSPTAIESPRFLDRMRACSDVVWAEFGEKVFDVSKDWTSDTARGWAAFAVPRAEGGLSRQVQLSLQFAKDPHFAVREWAWLGARPLAVEAPLDLLAQLQPYALAGSALVRRFCIEVTRPRSVWGRHIRLLREEPEHGKALLDVTICSSERYVRDALGNWLNDAARTRPDWVAEVSAAWQDEHGRAVEYVLRRGTRNL